MEGDSLFEYTLEGGDESEFEEKTHLTQNTAKIQKRMRSKVYFREELKVGFEIKLSEESTITKKPKASKSKKVFKLRDISVDHIDIEQDPYVRDAIYEEVFKQEGDVLEKELVDFYEERDWRLIRISSGLIKGLFQEAEIHIPDIAEISWVQAEVEKEKRLLDYIEQNPSEQIDTVIEKLGITKEYTDAIARSVALKGKLPSEINKPKRKRLSIPSKRQIQSMLDEAYKEKGYIAKSWSDFTSMLLKRHPIKEGEQVNMKTLQNKMREEYKLRSMKPKRKPMKISMQEHIKNQLILGGYLFKQMKTGRNVLYFDQTTFQTQSDDVLFLGATDMKPMITLTKSAAIHMLAIYSAEGIVSVMFLNNSCNSEEAAFALETTLEVYLPKINQTQCIVLLDNARYQTTTTFRKRAEEAGAALIYSIRQTPWINIIEDFFLALKSFMRNQKNDQERSIKEEVQKALVQIEGSDASWIVRKFTNNLLQTLQHHRRHIGKLDDKTWRYISSKTKISKALARTNEIQDINFK
jgi:hypothetical protein